jgi:FMN phosphatase YigB (HAD superfamily)
MIRAVVFDCFGVLTTDAWLPFKEKYFGHDKSLFDQATDLNKRSDGGFLSYDDFIHEIAVLANVADDVVLRAVQANVSNQPLFAWAVELKKTYKIGLLSNASDNWLESLFSPTELAIFDATALSFETGFIKPHAGAYEIIAGRLGVAVEDCVFIDDQERFCTGAQEAGMPAIWYRSVEQCKADFAALLNEN